MKGWGNPSVNSGLMIPAVIPKDRYQIFIYFGVYVIDQTPGF